MKQSGPPAAIEVDTTRDEIVDVTTSGTDEIARCLVEVVWATRLTAAFNRTRDHYTLAFK